MAVVIGSSPGVGGAKLAPLVSGPLVLFVAWDLSTFSSLDWTSICGSGSIPERPRWKQRLLNLQSVLSPTLNCAKQVINPAQIQEVRQQAPLFRDGDAEYCGYHFPLITDNYKF